MDGNFLDQWTGLLRPNNIHLDEDEGALYVAELGRRISIFDLKTRVAITSWGGDGGPRETPGEFFGGPHGICLDSKKNIYTGEVELGEEGRFHKYVRV